MLISHMQELWRRNELTDVILCCEDQYIKAHSVVLSAYSPTFRSMLKTPTYKSPGQLDVTIKDMKASSLKAIISYFYTGAKPDVNTDITRACTFLQLNLQWDELKEQKPIHQTELTNDKYDDIQFDAYLPVDQDSEEKADVHVHIYDTSIVDFPLETLKQEIIPDSQKGNLH